jgi:hypothetical protein
MSIRNTEKSIPAGVKTDELGECSKDNDDNYALVSYLSSPITCGTSCDYVLFVKTSKDPEKYKYIWRVTTGSSDSENNIQTETKETKTGVFDCLVTDAGSLKIEVDVIYDNEKEKTLSLEQAVIEPNKDLEMRLSGKLDDLLKNLIKNGGEDATTVVESFLPAWGGNPRVSRMLINDFSKYILNASHLSSANVDNGIPSNFLAAIVYAELLKKPYWDPTSVERRLNDKAEVITDAIGVCQLEPPIAAMVIVNPKTKKNYIETIKEFSVKDGLIIQKDKDDLLKIFQSALKNKNNDNMMVDIYNLLRFPRSNILIASRWLSALKNREKRWPKKPGEFPDSLLVDKSAIAVIAKEFKTGALGVDKGNAYFQKNDYGEKIIKLIDLPTIALPFRGLLKISGKVVDKEDNSKKLDNVKMKIYRTMVLVIENSKKSLSYYSTSETIAKNEIGKLDEKTYKGSYPVLEIAKGADCVKIKSNKLEKASNHEGWICTQEKDAHLALIYDEKESENFPHTDKDGNFSVFVNDWQVHSIRFVDNDGEHYDYYHERISIPKDSVELNLGNVKMEKAGNLVREKDILKNLKEFKGYIYTHEGSDSVDKDKIENGIWYRVKKGKIKYNGKYYEYESQNTTFKGVKKDGNDVKDYEYYAKVVKGTAEIKSGEIKVGEEYTVSEGVVLYNGSEYKKNEKFIGVEKKTDFSPTGKVVIYYDACYPYQLGDLITLPQPKKDDFKSNNCCTFTEALLIKSFQDKFGKEKIKWDQKKHNFWNIVSESPNSNDSQKEITVNKNERIDAIYSVEELGIGNIEGKVEDGQPPKNWDPVPWTLVQGFKNKLNGDWGEGHSFIIMDLHKESKRVLILESNSTDAETGGKPKLKDGPQFRQCGHIDKYEKQGYRLEKKEWIGYKLTEKEMKKVIWSKLTDSTEGDYKYRVMARLRVFDID